MLSEKKDKEDCEPTVLPQLWRMEFATSVHRLPRLLRPILILSLDAANSQSGSPSFLALREFSCLLISDLGKNTSFVLASVFVGLIIFTAVHVLQILLEIPP